MDEEGIASLYNTPLPSFHVKCKPFGGGWGGGGSEASKFLRWHELSEEQKKQVIDDFKNREDVK